MGRDICGVKYGSTIKLSFPFFPTSLLTFICYLCVCQVRLVKRSIEKIQALWRGALVRTATLDAAGAYWIECFDEDQVRKQLGSATEVGECK